MDPGKEGGTGMDGGRSWVRAKGVPINFMDLTKVSTSAEDVGFLSDELLNGVNRDRLGFYKNLLDSLSDKAKADITLKVLGIENRTKEQRDRIEERVTKLLNIVEYLDALTNKGASATAAVGEEGPSPGKQRLQIVGDLNQKASLNPMVADNYRFLSKEIIDNYFKLKEAALVKDDSSKEKKDLDKFLDSYGLKQEDLKELELYNEQKKIEKKLTGGGEMEGGSAFTDSLNRLLGAKDNLAEEKNQIVLYENDPLISPENTRITVTDRVVFIAVTYMIRTLALFVVEWGISNQMLVTFQGTFNFYLMVYLSIFALWAMLANISEEEVLFRTLFYYISVRPHGYGRIAIHILVQLLVLPIPLIVSDDSRKVNPATGYTFERRRAMVSVINQFTLIIWVFTSAIALSY